VCCVIAESYTATIVTCKNLTSHTRDQLEESS